MKPNRHVRRQPTMKVWLVNLFFGQGVAPSGVLLECLARALSNAGAQVEVIAGNTGYQTNQASETPSHPFRVHRVNCGVGKTSGLLGRLAAWLFFYVGTAWFAFIHRLPDRIVIMTTPPWLSAIFIVRNALDRRRAKLVVWNQDTYPEVLAAVGLLKVRSLTYRLLLSIQRWCMHRVHGVIALDKAMQQRLEQQGAGRVQVVPNWDPSVGDTVCNTSHNLSTTIKEIRNRYQFVVLYSGNYGWGHDLSLLQQYLSENPGQKLFAFLFIGGGEKWRELEEWRKCHDLQGFELHPYIPRSVLPNLIREVDFGLVALESDCAGLMSPSKIHGYLAEGKPLIYLGPNGSNVSEVIEEYQCGFQIDENNLPGLKHWLDFICSEAYDYNLMSRRALEAARSYCGEGVTVPKLLDFILA